MSRFLSFFSALMITVGAHASTVDGQDCESKTGFCPTIAAGNDTIIEVMSLFLPNTMSKVLERDSASWSVIKSIVEPIENRSLRVLDGKSVTIESTPISVYFGDRVTSRPDTVIESYAEDKAQHEQFAAVERAIIMVINIISYVLAVMFGLFAFSRILKMAYNINNGLTVFNNATAQIPLLLMLTVGFISTDGSMATIPYLFMCTFVLGALITSTLNVISMPFFIEIFSSEAMYNQDQIKSSAMFRSLVKESVDDLADELAESITLIDLEVARIIEAEIGGNVNEPRFRKAFDTENLSSSDIVVFDHRCVSGRYWHFNINSSDHCDELREILVLQTEPVIDDHRGVWVNGGLRNAILDELADKFTIVVNGNSGGVVSGDGFSEAAVDAVLNDVLKETYRRVNARKEIMCSVINSTKLNSYKKNYFCAKVDYETSTFSGAYHANELALEARKWGDRSDSEAEVSAKIQRENMITDVMYYEEAANALAEESKRLIAGDTDGVKFRINANNIVLAFFSTTRGVDLAYQTSQGITDSSMALVESVFGAIRHEIPTVEKTERGLAEIEDIDDWQRGCRSFGQCERSIFDERAFKVTQVNEYLDKHKDVGAIDLFIDKALNKAREKQQYEQNLFSSVYHNARWLLNTAALSKIVYNNGSEIALNAIESRGASDRELRKAKRKFERFGRLINYFVIFAMGVFIFGAVSLGFQYSMMVIGAVYRMMILVMFSPIYVAADVVKSDDKDEDENNVLVPEVLISIFQRSFVEVLSVSISIIVGLILTLVAYDYGKLLLMKYSNMVTDDALVIAPLVILFEVIMAIVIGALMLLKSGEYISYVRSKATEFMTDGLQVHIDVSNEIDELKSLMKGAF